MIKPNPKSWFVFLGFTFTTLATFYAFRDIVNHTFLHWDDVTYVLENQHIQTLSISNLYWMFTGHMANWHPLTWLSLSINFHISGPNPLWFKITNISIHLASSFLLYFLTVELLDVIANDPKPETKYLIGDKSKALAGMISCALFAVHPQHIESILWIVERKDVLCGFFFLATLLFYLKQFKEPHKHWANAAVITFLMAIMAKPMAVTLPAVLMLLDIYPLRRIRVETGIRKNLKLLFSNKWAYILVSGCIILITIFVQREYIHDTASLSAWSRYINANVGILHYITTFFYPVNLSPFYPHSDLVTNPSTISITPAALVVLLLVLGIYLWLYKNIQYPLAILIYLIITALPILGIVKVGDAAVADRYAYIPTAMLYIAIGTFLSHIFLLASMSRYSGVAKIAVVTCIFTIFTTLFMLSSEYSKHWRNDETLWKSVIQLFPDKALVAYNNLAAYHFKHEDHAQAIKLLETALELDSNEFDVLNNLGQAYETMGNHAKAENYFLKLVDANKHYPMSYIHTGDFYIRQMQIKKAQMYFNQALRLSPTEPEILFRNAYVEFLLNRFPASLRLLDHTIKIDNTNTKALQLKILVLLAMEQKDTASLTAQKLLRLDPDNKIAIKLMRMENQAESR